jgi:hypothetical protein
MPFSQTTDKHTEKYWTEHFEDFLKPLIEECPQLEAYRSEPIRGDIIRQIIKDLIMSPVVVADLTDHNPNVFWELGIRQSFRHCTITIAENGTKMPFDILSKGTHFYYPESHTKSAKFAYKFKSSILNCLAHPDTPGRGSFYEVIQKEEALRRIDGLIDENRYNSVLAHSLQTQIENKKGIINARFQYCSLELLLTHRYLDQPSKFYHALRALYLQILFHNSTYESIGESYEQIIHHYGGNKWKKEFAKSTFLKFDDFIAKLTAIRQKIETSLI